MSGVSRGENAEKNPAFGVTATAAGSARAFVAFIGDLSAPCRVEAVPVGLAGGLAGVEGQRVSITLSVEAE